MLFRSIGAISASPTYMYIYHALYPKLIMLFTINLGIDILTFSGVYLKILSYIADNIIMLTAIKYTFNTPLKY